MAKKQAAGKKPKIKLDSEKFKEIVKQAEKDHKEASGLEAGILSQKHIDTSKLQDLWEDISWSESPTLDKIANAPQIVTSGGARRPQQTQQEAQKEDDNAFKYTISSLQNKDEAKYIPSTQIRTNAEIIDTQEIGRIRESPEKQFNQQAFFAESSELSQRGIATSNVEKYTTPGRFDAEKAGREDPLKRKEVKYEFKQSGA